MKIWRAFARGLFDRHYFFYGFVWLLNIWLLIFHHENVWPQNCFIENCMTVELSTIDHVAADCLTTDHVTADYFSRKLGVSVDRRPFDHSFLKLEFMFTHKTIWPLTVWPRTIWPLTAWSRIVWPRTFEHWKKGKEFGWVSITPARGPLFGPTVLPILYHIFPSTVQVLHVVSW
jgi:hypothetical protein